MRYIDVDSTVFEADTADGVVTRMHKTSRAPAESDKAWMTKAAQRATVMMGNPIRDDTAENFLFDLENNGLIKRVDGVTSSEKG